MEENRIQCQWCGQIVCIVWVHGHGQCSNCGINIDECCNGEQESGCHLNILHTLKENDLQSNES